MKSRLKAYEGVAVAVAHRRFQALLSQVSLTCIHAALALRAGRVGSPSPCCIRERIERWGMTNVEEAEGFLGETFEELINRNASEDLDRPDVFGLSLKHLISKMSSLPSHDIEIDADHEPSIAAGSAVEPEPEVLRVRDSQQQSSKPVSADTWNGTVSAAYSRYKGPIVLCFCPGRLERSAMFWPRAFNQSFLQLHVSSSLHRCRMLNPARQPVFRHVSHWK